MNWSRITYFTAATTCVITSFIALFLGLAGVIFYNAAPKLIWDGVLGGIAAFMVIPLIVTGFAWGIMHSEHTGAPAKTHKEKKLHRWERKGLELEYAQRFSDPEYQEFLTKKVDSARY